jgi:hypothetical protein
MKKMMIFLASAVFAGCEYTVPLVTTPSIDIDRSVIGLWQRTGDDGKTESLLVLPLGQRECLVSYPAGSTEAMFGRGCLWRRGDMTLVQLDWFGTAQAKLPDDNRTFQFVEYEIAADTLRVRLLNADIVSKDLKTSTELARAIESNKNNRDLFRDEMVFKKVKN